MKHHLTETHEHNSEIHNTVLYILTKYLFNIEITLSCPYLPYLSVWFPCCMMNLQHMNTASVLMCPCGPSTERAIRLHCHKCSNDLWPCLCASNGARETSKAQIHIPPRQPSYPLPPPLVFFNVARLWLSDNVLSGTASYPNCRTQALRDSWLRAIYVFL